ncbi:hypothetical protein [Porphyromonas uenonis]|uniref:hypothetical protein n=1 Tax=Porphyromonas uenonis TaxID=281920 RepID=UPI001EE1F585|nr:hypothetical protein [Porphyromonas uenonis]
MKHLSAKALLKRLSAEALLKHLSAKALLKRLSAEAMGEHQANYNQYREKSARSS